MTPAIRVIDRIQDQADFTGSLTDANVLSYSNSLGKFHLTTVPSSILPNNVAYINTVNLFTASQAITNTLSASSGKNTVIALNPTYAQSGTSNSTDLLINRIETSIGSGSHYFQQFQVAAVDKFTVDHLGNVVANNISVNSPISSGNNLITYSAAQTLVNNTISGLDWKNSVKIATNSNIDIVNPGNNPTIDGVIIVDQDRILLYGQTTASENGIYTYNNPGGPAPMLTRSSDANISADVTSGMTCQVIQGTKAGDLAILSTQDPITLDTTSLSFIFIAGPGNYVQGSGITISGNTISIGSSAITNTMLAGSIASSKLIGSDIATVGTITTGTWHGTKIGLAFGGTNADLSATGGTHQVLQQSTVGGNISVGQLAFTDISGTLGVTAGGTGQTSANAALNALLPSQTGNSGDLLTTSGTNTSWTSSWSQPQVVRYVNPNTGNDSNVGTQSAPWKSFAPVNTFLAAGNPGAKILIDTTAGWLYTGPNYLALSPNSPNVEIGPATTDRFRITAGRLVGTGEWTKVGGLTNVYSCFCNADHTVNTGGPVPFENDLFYHLITGANLGAVQATIDSTQGSFWTDNTTMYIHPFGNTDPRIDGKEYVISAAVNGIYLGDIGTGTSVAGCYIHDGIVRDACAVNATTGTVSVTVYCVAGGGSGVTKIKNIDAYNWGNHAIATIFDAPYAHIIYEGCTARLANPYYGNIPFVDNADGIGGGGRNQHNITHEYIRCSTCLDNAFTESASQLLATLTPTGNSSTNTNGADNYNNSATAVGNHYTGAAPFSRIIHRDCYFPFGAVDAGDGITDGLWIYGGYYQFLLVHKLNAIGAIFKTFPDPDGNTQTQFGAAGLDGTNANITLLNCRVNGQGYYRPGLQVVGTYTMDGVEIDLTQAVDNGSPTVHLFNRFGTNTFAMRNCKVIQPKYFSTNIWNDFHPSDNPIIFGNEYILGNISAMTTQVNGSAKSLSIQDWKAFGYDRDFNTNFTPTRPANPIGSFSALTNRILFSKPLGFWPLNETTGYTAIDASGNGNTLEYVGCTQNQTAHVIYDTNPSITLNGTSDYLTGTGLNITGDFTAEAVIYKTATGGMTIVAQSNSNQLFIPIYFRINAGSGFTSAQGVYQQITVPDCSLNTVHHVALVKSGTTLTYYLDGVSTASGTVSGNPTYTNASFTIGTFSDAGGQFYKGDIQMVAVYNVALSSGEIQARSNIVSGGGIQIGSLISGVANKIVATPNGSAGNVVIRSLVSADLPNLDASKITTGSLAIGVGGTGQTSANAALNAFLPSQATNSGKVLSTDGTNTSWISAGGTGTVTSVSLTTPSWLSVTGSPITASGTLAVTATTGQTANLFLATPNGSTGAVSLRAIVGADLPNPSASTLGGIESLAAVTSKWINSISTSGVPSASQPSFTDISGSVAASQLPNPSASTLGGIESFAAISHQWINTISTGGIPSATQPAFTDISGTASTGQIPNLGGNPSVSVGLSAVNGTATTYLRSDGAPALSQSIVPTWTGVHIFAPTSDASTSGIIKSLYLNPTYNQNTGSASNISLQIDRVETALGSGSQNFLLLRGGSAGTTNKFVLDNTGTISTGIWNATKIGLLYGGTNADLSATGGASQVLKQVSSGAAVTVGQLAFTDISGTAVAGQIPNLDASKITTGLLALARGGTNTDLSGTGGTSQVLKQTSVGGTITVAQLAFTDISGSVAASQLPNPSASTLGGIESFAAQSNKWINAISTLGVPSATQPAFTDISGTLAINAGGTGQTTANNAFNALIPTQASNSGKFLTTDGSNTSWGTPAGGGGGSNPALNVLTYQVFR